MSCRLGDLAVVCNLFIDTDYNGMLVEVIAIGLPGVWEAPDGYSWSCSLGAAGVRSLGSPFAHPATKTPYTAVSQSNLRPIRPGDISDEEVRDLYAPKLPEHA